VAFLLSWFLVPASCFLLPASCFLLPSSSLFLSFLLSVHQVQWHPWRRNWRLSLFKRVGERQKAYIGAATDVIFLFARSAIVERATRATLSGVRHSAVCLIMLKQKVTGRVLLRRVRCIMFCRSASPPRINNTAFIESPVFKCIYKCRNNR